jgi:signal transduction histidine kinase
MKVRQISTGDLRALVTLLILLPCIPAALFYRFVHDTVAGQSQEAAALLQERVLGGIKPELPKLRSLRGEPDVIAATAFAALRDKLPSDLGITLRLDPPGKILAGEIRPPNTALVIETLHPPALKLEIFDRKPINPMFDTQVIGAFAGIIIVVTGISLAAGYAVHRRISLADMRSSLLANVSHDLKMPLTSSRLIIETLKDNPSDPAKAARYADLLLAQNEILERRVDALLVASQIRRSRLDFTPEPIHARDLAQSLRERFAAQIDPATDSFDVEIDDACPLVHADRSAMPLLLEALVDNAITHTSSPRVIRVRFAPGEGRMVVVTVEDNGPGLPAAIRKRAPKPFQRGNTRLDAAAPHGMGLGLWIADTLAKTLHGGLAFTNLENGGTRARLLVPACRDSKRKDEDHIDHRG